MQRFRSLFEKGKQYKICLFEGQEKYWPIVDGWTQEKSPCHVHDSETFYSINYFNDKKNFEVYVNIKEHDFMPDSFEGDWNLVAWGQQFKGVLKNEKSIKSVLKKAEVLYDQWKKEGMKKIPNFPKWKKIVTDTEISFSRKQDDRSVIITIEDVNGFISNTYGVSSKVSVFDDSMSTRVTENEYFQNGGRRNIKNLMSNLNIKFFK